MAMALGLILGNRNFFPDHLISEARRALTILFAEVSVNPIWLPAEAPDLGSVATWADAVRCGEMFTDDPLETFGTKAVVKIPKLPKLMKAICRNGFEHHAAMNGSYCAVAVNEAMSNYMGWETYFHGDFEA